MKDASDILDFHWQRQAMTDMHMSDPKIDVWPGEKPLARLIMILRRKGLAGGWQP